MEQTTKSGSWFGPVESEEKAIKVINHISKVFEILGGISILGFFILTNFSFESRVAIAITGITYVILGFLLGKFKKPVIAIILLLLSLAGVLVAILNLFGVLGNTQNRGLPIIWVAMAIASFQAIKATRKYNEEK